jgi:spore coat protein H
VNPGRHALALLCAALAACGGASAPPASGPSDPPGGAPIVEPPFALPPLQASLPEYALEIPQETLDLFVADPFAPEQPATFRSGGVTLPAKVELRGASARFFPKKSWNVDLEAGRWDGRRRLKLVAEYQDATMMVEKLGYDLLAAVGVAAPRGRWVRLFLNGAYQGVYLDLDAVDKPFLASRGFDPDASIYRCGWWNCEMKTWDAPFQGELEKRTNEAEPWDDVRELMRAVNETPEPELARELERRMNLEAYLRAMAVDALVSNNYLQDSESFLVHDRVRGRWSYVPWDMNNADARWWYRMPAGADPLAHHPLVVFTPGDPDVASIWLRRRTQVDGVHPSFSNLTTRVVNDPELLARYLALVERGLDEVFRPEVLEPWLDRAHALLDASMRDDPWMDPQKWAEADGFLTAYVRERVAFLRAELERLRARQPGVVLEVVDPQAGRLVLRNRGAAPAELGGMVLTASLRDTIAALALEGEGGAAAPRNVPAVRLAPGESLSLDAAALGLALAPAGEVGLFDGKAAHGVVDLLLYGPVPSGRRYARGEDGRWTVR